MNKFLISDRFDAIKIKFKEYPGKIMKDAGMELGEMTLKNKYLAVAIIGFYLTAWTGAAEASFSITHSGSTDPATEGFGVWPNSYGS
jgi:hypothetical protein